MTGAPPLSIDELKTNPYNTLIKSNDPATSYSTSKPSNYSDLETKAKTSPYGIQTGPSISIRSVINRRPSQKLESLQPRKVQSNDEIRRKNNNRKLEDFLMQHIRKTSSTESSDASSFLISPMMNPVKEDSSVVKKYQPDEIVVGVKLGSGAFSEVYLGELRGVPVALKLLRNLNSRILSQEISLLTKFDHPNVVKFLGVFASADKMAYIVMEYMNKGALNSLLETQRNEISISHLLEMCKQVAQGMEYLESKKIVHRDLACRNLLVKDTPDGLLIKISDFGLSREVADFYESEEREVPIKWTAPEVFRYNKHGPKSDVWSFGITIWEIFEYGMLPYPDMDNNTARVKVLCGYRLPQPIDCPLELYSLIMRCWEDKPEARPTFNEIAEKIQRIIDLKTPILKPRELRSSFILNTLKRSAPEEKKEEYNPFTD